MSKSSAAGHSAATLIDDYLNRWLNAELKVVAGHEQEAVIELIRSVDLHAYFLYFFRSPELTAELAFKCEQIRAGITPLLCKLLPTLEDFEDGIPWVPSAPGKAAWADIALFESGKLVSLRRLIYMERYGLTRCVVHSENHISIHLAAVDNDALDRADHLWMVNNRLDKQRKLQENLNCQLTGWARDRIDKYVDVHEDHFIQYDSDSDLLNLYQRQIECLLLTSLEADALPDNVSLGPFTFGEWKKIAITGAARALLHISFATHLSTLNKGRLNLRNLLTIFVRHEDLRAVWSQQTGIDDEQKLNEISDVFMLTTKHVESYFAHHDLPLAYNIRFGKYFALLPQFGYLANTCTFLVTQLKKKYEKDWFNAVNAREAQFQYELYNLLGDIKYCRGRDNVVIRRPNGQRETDIDAVLFEVETNIVYLIQLKWFDVFGNSLKERASKINNLLKANKWVEQVSRWIKSGTNLNLNLALGLKLDVLGSPPFETRLIVLARPAARFGGNHLFDRRAAWISWPQLCRVAHENQHSSSPLSIAWHAAQDVQSATPPEPSEPKEYHFPDLRIDVYG